MHNRTIVVLAEVIETKEELDFLKHVGTDFFQGYWEEREIFGGNTGDFFAKILVQLFGGSTSSTTLLPHSLYYTVPINKTNKFQIRNLESRGKNYDE